MTINDAEVVAQGAPPIEECAHLKKADEKKSSSSFNYANVTNKATRRRRSTFDAGLDAGVASLCWRRLLLLPLTNSRAACAQQRQRWRRRRRRRCLWAVVVVAVVVVAVAVVGSVACLWLLCALIACCPVTQARATSQLIACIAPTYLTS